MIDRLKLLIEYYGLSSSSFADKIDVPRSSISHLLSGRNRPSLDFIMKVVESFEEVELNWIVYGQGTFPSTKIDVEEKIEEPKLQGQTPNLFSDMQLSEQKIEQKVVQKNIPKEQSEKITIHENPIIRTTNQEKINTPISSNGKKLIKIVLLYDNGTFDEFVK